MTIRPNRYYGATGTTSGYNSPEIGQAASSLGKMFSGIPEAADVRSAAEAKATTEKANRLAYLFANPNASDFDRQAIAAGLQTGTSSLYAVDQNNTTSRANTAASNVTTLEQEKLKGQNSLAQLFATPQTAKEGETVYLPKQFQAAAGLGPTLSGGVKLNQGQDYTGPDGSTIAGPAKPLSETDIRARVLAGLPANDQRAAVLSGVGVETALGPDGKPVFVNRSDAAGMQPQGPDMSGKTTNYGTTDGKRGIAVPNRDGKMFDAQTGAELPAQATIYGAQAAGTPDQLSGKITDAQGKYGLALAMTEEPSKIIDSAFAGGKLPTAGDDVIRGLAERAGPLSPLLTRQMSPEAQNLHQAIKNAIPYQLLGLSGQGVTEQEYERTTARMIPLASDTPEVLAQKRSQFATYRKAIQGLAGPAASAAVGVAPQPAAPAPSGAAPSPGQTTMPSLAASVPREQQNQQSAAGAPIAMPPGMPAPAGGGGSGQPVRVNSPDEARRLPSGTQIILPDGSTGRVP